MAAAGVLTEIGFSSIEAAHIGYTVQLEITATGTTDTNSTPLTATVNHIHTSGGGGTSGVILPNAKNSPLGIIVITNYSPNQIYVWPSPGDSLTPPTVPAYTLPAFKSMELYKTVREGTLIWLGVSDF